MEKEQTFSKISIKNNSKYIAPTIAYANIICQGKTLCMQGVQQLLYVLGVALNHIVLNSFDSDERDLIHIEFYETDQGVRIKIEDQGLPGTNPIDVEWETLKDQKQVVELKSLWVTEYVDHMDYQYIPLKGNVLTIEKHKSELSWQKLKAPLGCELMALKSFKVRPFICEDALYVTRCFYDAYGYTYSGKLFYNPNKITELHYGNKLRSMVTVDEQNQVLGHVALKRNEDFAPVWEMVGLVIRPRYRRLGLAETMVKRLLKEAQNNSIEGLFVESVTIHTASQKLAYQSGLRIACIKLGGVPEGIKFKEIGDQLNFLQASVFMHAPLKKTTVSITIPTRYKAIVKRIYDNLGITVEENKEPSPFLTYTEFIVRDNNFTQAEILIKRVGADFKGLIKGETERMMQNGAKIIYLKFSLADGNVDSGVEWVRKMGYLLAGVVPKTRHGQLIVMQKVQREAVNMRKINLIPENQWLMDAIYKEHVAWSERKKIRPYHDDNERVCML